MPDGAFLCALFLFGFLMPVAAVPVLAQDANLTVFQRLALECLGELPSGVDTVSIDASEQMPYLRSALIEHWRSNGREIYAADNAAPQAAHLPRLAFTVEDAGVAYAPAGRRQFNRSVHLGLRYSMTDSDGRIILDDRCARTAADIIDRSAVVQVEDEAFDETQGELPRAGWMRRIVEPVVITAATAIGVYLFFTLRSQSTDDG